MLWYEIFLGGPLAIAGFVAFAAALVSVAGVFVLAACPSEHCKPQKPFWRDAEWWGFAKAAAISVPAAAIIINAFIWLFPALWSAWTPR